MNLAKKGKIISIKQIAKRTIEVAIEVPDDFNFHAGQYIWLMVPELKYPDPKGNARMFSIASSPNKKKGLVIAFRTGESGFRKTLAEMAAGDKVVFSGPYGHMKLPENNSSPAAFLIGGIAIAPLLSMAKFSTETHSDQKITVIWANNNEEEAAYLDELERIEKENLNFKLIKIYGRLELEKEPIKQLVSKKLQDKQTVWHVLGPADFVNYAGKFLNSSGVPLKNIIFEQFYPEIPEKIKLEQKIGEARANKYPFFLAAESAKNHIIITDVNGTILYANKGAEKITGYTFEEMKNNTPRLWGGLMSPDFYKEFWEVKKYKLQTFTAEIKNRRKNQEEYYAILHSSPILDENGNLAGFVATEEDITDRKNTEELLKKSEAKYRNLVDAMQEGLGVQDKNGLLVFMNNYGCEMLGYKPEEIIGKPVAMLMDDENKKILREQMVKRSMGEYQNYEIEVLRKDGEKVDLIVSPSPYFDEEENFVESVAVFTNITERKRVEKKLREIDQSKSEFISIASHQLRTPVSGLNWIIEALSLDSENLNQKQKEYLKNLSMMSKRLIMLVEDLLNISRIELKAKAMAEKNQIDVAGFIEEFLKEIGPYANLKKHNIIFKRNRKESPKIEINKKSLYSVLQNLVTNSIDYSPENTAVCVNLEKTDNFIKVSVSNRGPAIPKDEQVHIFERFYRGESTKKMKAEGTGLGLYIVKIIIEESGGKVGFESIEGKDVIFWFTIPLLEATGK